MDSVVKEQFDKYLKILQGNFTYEDIHQFTHLIFEGIDPNYHNSIIVWTLRGICNQYLKTKKEFEKEIAENRERITSLEMAVAKLSE